MSPYLACRLLRSAIFFQFLIASQRNPSLPPPSRPSSSSSSYTQMDPKFLRNQRYARKHNKKSADAEAEE